MIQTRRNLIQAVTLVIIALITFSGCARQPEPAPTAAATPAPETSQPPAQPAATQPPAMVLQTEPPSIPATQPAAVTASPEPPQPAGPMAGVELHSLTQAGGLDLMQQAGVTYIRRNSLEWAQIEPQAGVRQWEAVAGLETELQNAAAAGFQVILIIRTTPQWAQGIPGVPCGPVKAENMPDFAAFVRAAVARYSVPPYNVQYFEIGNEPDVDYTLIPVTAPYGCWGKIGDPYYGGEAYADMLKVVYPALKQANSSAQLLVGGLLLDCDPLNPPASAADGQAADCSPGRYLEGILTNGGGDFFDGVSFHAYDYYAGELGKYANPNWHSAWNITGPVVEAKTAYLTSVLQQFNHPEKYLMNTEVALICGRDGSEPVCQTDEYQSSKAYYLAEEYALARKLGLRANVWYSILGWRGSGLVNREMQPLPAYQALSFSSRQLREASFVKDVDLGAGLRALEFSAPGKRFWLAWSLDGAEHPIQLPQAPAFVYDVAGNAQNAAASLTLTMAPVYIEWTQ